MIEISSLLDKLIFNDRVLAQTDEFRNEHF